jgi:hypothetical protein
MLLTLAFVAVLFSPSQCQSSITVTGLTVQGAGITSNGAITVAGKPCLWVLLASSVGVACFSSTPPSSGRGHRTRAFWAVWAHRHAVRSPASVLFSHLRARPRCS